MNRLAETQSPYLLQHQDNPVDWYPWGEEAFEKARAEDKPVFLSIGYSTCHWCHVMAHESFEDDTVARLMNETFVNIKVDREERPDIDGVYMTVCQMMTGHGGWPLTVVMTPDKKPFFAGTYLPRESRHGRLGMLDFVPRIAQLWRDERDHVTGSAERLTELLRKTATLAPPAESLDADALHLAFATLRRRYDPQHGGFGTAPKFPAAHNLLFLLRYRQRTDEPMARTMVETTLRKMRLGGIYDHLGYGFHRYSTDARWKLPHFEKMLYDQAMLALAYVEAFQAFGQEEFAATAREIFAYVRRDLTAPEGGFYAAEDADSEGREGVFYLWHRDELDDLLGEDLAAEVARVYHVVPEGNFEDEATRQKTGENILYLDQPLGAATEARLAEARRILFEHRAKRVRPGLDDKILTDWNGLMIAALARAARVFGESEYAAAARRAADFILATLRRPDGGLLHRYRHGDAAITGTLDDYAFMAWGLIELYETTFATDDLEAALALVEYALDHFWDDDGGAFFFTPDDGEPLLVRQKEGYDGAIPSGNSVMMLNLLRLARLTGRTAYEEKAEALGRAFAPFIEKQPTGFTAMLMALDFAVGPAHEIVIAGRPEAADTEAMLAALRRVYVPNKVVLLRPPGEAPEIARLAPYAEAQTALDGRATAYVCRHFQCEHPTTDPATMLALLGR